MKPRPSKPKDVERLLLKMGFVHVRAGSGSHRFYRHPDGRTVVVAFHGSGRTIPIGTLQQIVGDIGLSVEEFNQRV